MAKPRTVLIVGAGIGQVPAIEAARRLGWRSVVVDRSSTAPGMALADRAYTVDIVDLEGVLAVARDERVDGAMTMQSDLPVPTIGYVNQALGLAGVDVEVAATCSRKDLARLRWQAAGVPQPPFAVVRDLDEALAAVGRVGIPCVVKATDSSGSRGVVKVDHEAELSEAVREASKYLRSGPLLIEGFVPGTEVGAQTFSAAGKCELVLLHNDQVSAPPYMVPTGHSYPFEGRGVDEDELKRVIAGAVEALGIRDGPANVDVILTEDGRPMLLEIGARIGATCLPELTSVFTGIDWVEASLRSSVGEQPQLQLAARQACAALIIEAPADGILDRFEVEDWVRDDANVVELSFSARPGDTVSMLRKGTDRIGHVLVKGRDLLAAEGLASRVRDAIRVLLR